MGLLYQFKLLSEYNQLMNQRLYAAIENLPDEVINEDKGAFFKSIIGTLNHILVGDIIWLKRFSTNPASYNTLKYFVEIKKVKLLNTILYSEFSELKNERYKIDELIILWITSLGEHDLDTNITYKNMQNISFQKDFSSLINHLFLHQVHHRGQVTTLLSQIGVDFGETDIIEIF
jgi:uncharacterized damage-inducible protein DinB